MQKSFRLCPWCMRSLSEDGNPCPSCGRRPSEYAPSPHHLPPGTVLSGRYLLGAVLGEGGCGITYMGYDLVLEMRAAIKEYYPVERCTRNASVGLEVISLTGIQARYYELGKEKYLREARILAKMEKQQVIVGVRDYFEENNTAYIVMEYIEGETLTDLVKRQGGRIPEKELFDLVKPLFGALDALHRSGLLHRDICPDNLMLEREGALWADGFKMNSPFAADGHETVTPAAVDSFEMDLPTATDGSQMDSSAASAKFRSGKGVIRLLDFGLARDASSLKNTLTLTLRHGYAPIEQYQQGGGQGPWTDIYALCATLYFCLTGVTPSVSTNRITEDLLLPPSSLGVEVPEYREKALMKGLRIQPHRRFSSVMGLAKALYRLEDGIFPG